MRVTIELELFGDTDETAERIREIIDENLGYMVRKGLPLVPDLFIDTYEIKKIEEDK